MLKPDRLRWAIVLLVCAVALLGRARAETPVHWSEMSNAHLATCDDLAALGQYEEATYCATRYQAAAAGLWTDSADPQFAAALPVLGLLGVAGLGFAIGSAVYPR